MEAIFEISNIEISGKLMPRFFGIGVVYLFIPESAKSVGNILRSFEFCIKKQSFEKTARKVLECIFCNKIKTIALKYMKILLDIPFYVINKL